MEDLPLNVFVVHGFLPIAESFIVINVDVPVICSIMFILPKSDVFNVYFCINLVQQALEKVQVD